MGRGFFDLMMFNPIATDENGSNEMDLHSVLVSANSVVRSSLEEVDGRACYVVDETDPEAQGVTFTAWIDPGRGFLPVRQQYVNPVTHRVKMEFVTESALEIQPGIWLPVLGHKTLRPNVVVPECPSGIVETLMLDGYQQGHPAIAVNTGVDDSVFDVISSLPQGVRVLDQDTGQSWTVAAADRRGPSPDVEIARARGFPSRQVLVVLGSLLTSIGFAGTRRAGRRCPTGAMPR
jgi:hypothetical protein